MKIIIYVVLRKYIQEDIKRQELWDGLGILHYLNFRLNTYFWVRIDEEDG